MSAAGTPPPFSPGSGRPYPGQLPPIQPYQAPQFPQQPYAQSSNSQPAYPAQAYPQHGYPQPPQRPPTPSREVRDDVEAALAARGELGADYDPYIAASLAQRVEELTIMRVHELRAQSEAERQLITGEQTGRGRQLALAIVSLALGIPTTAITGVAMGSESATAIAWVGIVGVNWAHAWVNRRRR